MSDFAALDTHILGISIDSTWCHDAWAQHLGLTYPLLSDMMHEVGQAYGVFAPDRNIHARAVFLVDKAGIIRYKEEFAPGTLPDPEGLLGEVRKL